MQLFDWYMIEQIVEENIGVIYFFFLSKPFVLSDGHIFTIYAAISNPHLLLFPTLQNAFLS